MDEEDDTEENVNSILAQESSELLTILSCQSSTVIMSLYQMMPSNMKQDINYPACSAAALTEPIKAMLEYFREASAADCSHFLQSVCMLCENIPMHLESRLMSVAGYANTDAIQFPTTETTTLRNTDENSSPSRTDEKLSLPLSPHQLVKRPRIGSAYTKRFKQCCIAATFTCTIQPGFIRPLYYILVAHIILLTATTYFGVDRFLLKIFNKSDSVVSGILRPQSRD